MRSNKLFSILINIFAITLILNIMQFAFFQKTAVAGSISTAKTVSAKVQPKYVLCSPVKDRKIISTFSKNRNGRPHKGTDYVSRSGNSAVYAFYKGVIVIKEYESSMGNYVVIKHNVNGKIIYSTYMHLKSYKNITGYVLAGRQIATMGNTGSSFGTHLHFQIGDAIPHTGTNITLYNGDKMIANGYTFYNSERAISTNLKIIK